ncbi:Dihydrolipoamide dehydrogenase of 2-oxoglutarate dehydrogenase [hydrothermal vent metagenome]|uniref:Dihydrolipoyl dehydrogenase n=1 Tax=hydrothermal vent metagenome TaxID=652676 RepID=A0A3B0YRQ5_9ZZZZ
MSNSYDVIVIGAGPAGYVAAIRCAQLGLRTACIDQWLDPDGEPVLGGTCLNVGCIPSKSLLESSEHYVQAQQGLGDHGIDVSTVTLNLTAMQARKQRIVRELTQGIQQLFKANKIDWIQGCGQLLAGQHVSVNVSGQVSEYQATNIILAPGSSPVQLDRIPWDNDIVVDSAGALALEHVPRRLGVIGAGVIGLELGSVWRRLGAEQVTLLEAQDQFLPMADEQVAKEALKAYTQQGLDIQLGCRVTTAEVKAGQVDIVYQDADGNEQAATYDKLIVAVGRRPNTEALAVDEAGLLLDEWGFVHINEQCRTNLPGIYAIGDAVRGPMLAHKGSEEGVMVAELIAGHAARVNYELIPSVIYTLPEVAWVGKTEQALKAVNADYRAGVFPFVASGRARAMGQTGGFVKLLADKQTDRILGAHLIGPQCSELVAELVVVMQLGGSIEDLCMTVFAHPSLSESVHEAALDVDGRAMHMVSRKRND